jgi:hypothetical protein
VPATAQLPAGAQEISVIAPAVPRATSLAVPQAPSTWLTTKGCAVAEAASVVIPMALQLPGS